MSPDSPIASPTTGTVFLDPLAVEAWDTWFRWREEDRLRDVTIDDTWQRVAGSIAAAETSEAHRWRDRFLEAFSRWRLLPDERLLKSAGTDHYWHFQGPPVAVLNIAAFVRPGSPARLDHGGLVETAALAVRLLDDAGLAAHCDNCSDLSIGVVGVANALQSLGLAYESAEAVAAVQGVGRALAEGCLQGTVSLARIRGARAQPEPDRMRHWSELGLSADLIEDGRRHGLRHARLTAISRRPRLARLANNVADALDPIATAGAAAMRRRAGDMRPASRSGIAPRDGDDQCPSLAAQMELRGAVQPWIDAPIDYPLVANRRPDAHASAACQAVSQRLGLPVPEWRLIEGFGAC